MVLVATKQCSSRLVIGSITTLEAHQTHNVTINIILRFLWCSFLLPAWFRWRTLHNFPYLRYGTLRRYRQWDNGTLGNDVWLGQAKASALETISNDLYLNTLICESSKVPYSHSNLYLTLRPYHYYVYSNIPSSMNWCVASTGPSTAYIHNLHGLPCKWLIIREHMCKQPPPSIVKA